MADPQKPERDPAAISPASAAPPADDTQAKRAEMIDTQIRRRNIRDRRVLAAMLEVPRHAFVPGKFAGEAYNDQPLPIGESQTISQPYMVASMTEALELVGSERVLEIGSGSGYQSAILSVLARAVYTIENHEMLANLARENLARLGYHNVSLRLGDGTLGWPEEAPFDAILVTAAAPRVPPPLLEQLADGGRLVLPMGSAETQELIRVRRRGAELYSEAFYPCRFVPLVGRYGWPGDPSAAPSTKIPGEPGT